MAFDERPALTQPRQDFDDGFEIITTTDMPAGAANWVNEATVAQIVPKERDDVRVLVKCRELAAAMPYDRLTYRLPFRTKDDNGKWITDHIEGPTIKCAMLAMSQFGNCTAECVPMEDKPTHWTFLARFRDLERGITVIRAFRQRKSQSTGMEKKDRERAIDLLFQIGQSKAIRNVVVASIPHIIDEMQEAVRDGLLSRIERNLDASLARVLQMAADLNIDRKRIERRIGKASTKWAAPDVASVGLQLSSVKDGMAIADELFPVLDDETDTKPETKDESPKKDAKAETKPKATAKLKAETKKEDPPAEPAKVETTDDGEPDAGQEETAEDTAASPADEDSIDDTLPPDPDDEDDGLDFGD